VVHFAADCRSNAISTRIGGQHAISCEWKEEESWERHWQILIARGGAGIRAYQADVKEFVDVVKRRLGAFHQQALRRLGNAADAEDAVQDALLSAFTHLDRFKGQAQMSTWLTTIVINSARMKLRRRPRQLHIPLEHRDEDREQFKFAETLSDHRPNPEQICRKGEFGERLAECSARLSPCLRKTFELRDVEGLSIREAAKVMEVPRGTMKGRLPGRAGMKEMVRKSLGKKRVGAKRWIRPQ
jgi:RNA polymerase sigma-70 factor, ECF subfamily